MPDQNRKPNAGSLVVKTTKRTKRKARAGGKVKNCSHTKNGLRYKSVKANRGSKSDTKGDKNARGDSK